MDRLLQLLKDPTLVGALPDQDGQRSVAIARATGGARAQAVAGPGQTVIDIQEKRSK